MLKNETFTLIFPKMNAYRRDLDETKYISFLIKDDELLEKYNKIWEKLKTLSKRIWQWTSIQWKIFES